MPKMQKTFNMFLCYKAYKSVVFLTPPCTLLCTPKKTTICTPHTLVGNYFTIKNNNMYKRTFFFVRLYIGECTNVHSLYTLSIESMYALVF
jgi:hypothetical protein